MKHARPDYNRIQDPDNKIPENEPVFLLRAQDVAASLAVDAWAGLAARAGADPKIVQMAREQAQLMREWQLKKVPDLPEGQ